MNTPADAIAPNRLVSINRPPLTFRMLGIIVGTAFVLFGLLADGWLIVPFGLLGLLAAGLESRVTAEPAKRRLSLHNVCWSIVYNHHAIDVPEDSVIIGLTTASGSMGGDGISLLDSYSLHLDSPGRRRAVIAWGYTREAILSEGRDLADTLGIPYRAEESG